MKSIFCSTCNETDRPRPACDLLTSYATARQELFENKKILITGGTGSLGQALTERLLQYDPERIRIFSRNEHNQTLMNRRFKSKKLRFLLGDIRDHPRLVRAMEDADIVFHAAALKDVVRAEYNPFESIKTNVIGAQNMIDACRLAKVKLVMSISTDKAVSPLNVYGTTKLLMEKLATSARNYVNISKHPTMFGVVRYGNVLGSSGSVVPKFIRQINAKQTIMITSSEMTRFNITMDDAVDFILDSAKKTDAALTFVPKLKAYNIMDLKDALFEIMGRTEYEVTKIRAGEKLAEVLINEKEIQSTLEGENNFVIAKDKASSTDLERTHTGYKRVTAFSRYSSDVVEKLSKKELVEMLEPLVKRVGRISNMEDANAVF